MAPRDTGFNSGQPDEQPDGVSGLQNTEAEQALLGAILVNNKAYGAVVEFLRPRDFCKPVHGRIFGTMGVLIDRGEIANPVTLKNQFDQDGALEQIGGAQYLAKLAQSAVTIINAEHYGRTIRELADRRDRISALEEAILDLKRFDPERPATTVIEDLDRHLIELDEGGRADSPKSNRVVIRAALEAAEQVYQGRSVGISTGLLDLDSKLAGGLKPSNLIVIAGRPAMGKTSLALTMALSGARNGKSALFFSLEMSDTELGQRQLAVETGISVPEQQQGPPSKERMDSLIAAGAVLAVLPLTTDDSAGQTVTRIRRRALQEKRRHGLDVIFVDHLHLIQSESGRTDTRAQQISAMTAGLKGVAKELQVPVVLLAQLNRNVEGRDEKRPQLSDLRDSGSIEQDADVIIFPFREEYYVSDAEPRRKPKQSEAEFLAEYKRWGEHLDRVRHFAELHVAKQRNGKTGTAKVRFDEERTCFEDLAWGELNDAVRTHATDHGSQFRTGQQYASLGCPSGARRPQRPGLAESRNAHQENRPSRAHRSTGASSPAGSRPHQT